MMTQTGAQDVPDEMAGGADNGHGKSKTKFQVYRPQWNPKSRVTTDTLDMAYIKSISGMLKIVEIFVCLIALICTLTSIQRGHAIWTEYVIWTTGLLSCLIFLLYTFFPHLSANRQPTTQKGMHMMELVFCASSSLLHLISFCVMAALAAESYISKGYQVAASLSCIFCFFLFVIYLVDALFSHKCVQSYSKTEAATSAYEGPLPQATVLHRNQDV